MSLQFSRHRENLTFTSIYIDPCIVDIYQEFTEPVIKANCKLQYYGCVRSWLMYGLACISINSYTSAARCVSRPVAIVYMYSTALRSYPQQVQDGCKLGNNLINVQECVGSPILITTMLCFQTQDV